MRYLRVPLCIFIALAIVSGCAHHQENATVETDLAPPPSKTFDTWPVCGHGHITLNNILFQRGKAVVSPEGKAEADKLIAEMKKFPQDTVTLEGHTCAEGDWDYSLQLGKRRAEAVRDYLVAQGIAPERIRVVSYGETMPAEPPNPARYKVNRRVVFKIEIGDESGL